MSDRESVIRQIVTSIATKLQGLPYIWGGSSPRVGFDCSGFVIWLYQCVGLLPSGDWTAHDLSRLFLRTDTPKAGDLAFYGQSDDEVSHVMMHLDSSDSTVIGASGGDHTTLTADDAARKGACVKIKAVRYRLDYLHSGSLSSHVSS